MIRVIYDGILVSEFLSYSEVLNKILSYNELCISIFSIDEWNDENPTSKLSINDNKVIVIANTDGVSYFYDDKIDKETIQRIITELKLFMFTIEEY
ncbi:hypothetical protein DWZ94_01030 [Veillonella atypica]|uniref:hypothetical protein n=1 Tax=Veillonella atypica TaxID=39777 RepID=UPI000E550AB1|nr:hypothetical protein [Veillonella atypica]RHL92892.1 hypothetical protein DWZ94_01030 [Veillonella atypica]